jgi:hypothetical protein
MDMGAAIAAAMTFLKWPGQGRARVVYIDCELPIETFKERIKLVADCYGEDIQFYGYNRDALGDDGLPPLNTEAGQTWLRREIDASSSLLIRPPFKVTSGSPCWGTAGHKLRRQSHQRKRHQCFWHPDQGRHPIKRRRPMA